MKSLLFDRNSVIFWKISLMISGLIALSSGLIKSPGFWSSYLLDIIGPAWIYMLIRAQYKSGNSTFLSIRSSPECALIFVVSICAAIETGQYFELYPSHFDPFDFLAYISVVIPIYLIDKWMIRIGKEN